MTTNEIDEDRWIPTTERLPNNRQLCWVTCTDESIYNDTIPFSKNVIAWKPCMKPKPYKQEHEIVNKKDEWFEPHEIPILPTGQFLVKLKNDEYCIATKNILGKLFFIFKHKDIHFTCDIHDEIEKWKYIEEE